MRVVLARIFGGIALVLLLFLAVGLFLPGRWSVEESLVIEAGADEIFPWLDTVSLWEEWTPWPEESGEADGPASGVGAARTWDDPVFGAGSFTIVESRPPRRIAYTVLVEGGAMQVDGEFTLAPSAAEHERPGTLVTWSESGDFGWNPLLGYVALTMSRSQGEELRRGLDRLARAVERGRTAGPPDR
jgi:hypothetical protein